MMMALDAEDESYPQGVVTYTGIPTLSPLRSIPCDLQESAGRMGSGSL